ncbi:oxidoreductase [Domibacillus mangrovi]|uniref:Oxidoreductase n=1 Tax=Domibacillus mangrovi TaxID=1714354 RepID=A0A1Q5NZY6_9BACI|nr:oxidoreductase [Domibacillus mangrovi]
MIKAIQTGLVGYGLSGFTFHAPFMKTMDEFSVVKIMSSNEEKVKKDFPDTEVTNDFELVIRDADVELIIITTPNEFHFDMAKRSIEAGKHVIIEKPMVIESAKGDELVQLAEKHDVMLSVYQNRRYDGNFQTVKKLIDDGALGDINTYEARYDRFCPVLVGGWREKAEPGAGMLYDLGAHLIDQALYLFGMPHSVTADVQVQREDGKTDDYFHIILAYGKKRAILHCGLLALEQGPKYKVHGDKGTFIKYGEDGQESDLKEGKRPGDEGWGMDRPELYGTLYTEESEEKIVTVPGAYMNYYKGVYDCIRNGADCPVPGEDGVNTIRLIEAAIKSSEEKRTVKW